MLPRRRRRRLAGLAGRAAGGRGGVPGPRRVRRPDPRAARGDRPARLRARARADHHARPRSGGSRRRPRLGREPGAAPRRRSRAPAGSTPPAPGPATRRSGSAGCAPPAGGSATSRPRASTTAAPAPTRGSPASRAPPGTAAASRAATTRPRARRPASPASCARSPAASGTSRRHRCGNGIVMTAHSAGRLREALAPQAPPAQPGPDYLSGSSGTLGRRALLAGRGARSSPPTPARSRSGAPCAGPRRRSRRAGVLVAGVARPELQAVATRDAAELRRSRHDVALHLDPAPPGAGKWANLRATLAAHPPAGADWLLLVDDDVAAPRRLPRRVRARRGARSASSSPSPRTRSRRTPPGRSRAAVPGARAPDALRRDRPGHRDPPRRVRRPCSRSRTCAMGWGLDAHWSARAARRGTGARRRRRHPDPPPAPDRRDLPARGRRAGGGGATWRTART